MTDSTSHSTSRSPSPKPSCTTALESRRWKALNACNDPPTELESASVSAVLVQARNSLAKLREQMLPLLLVVCDTQSERRVCQSDEVWRRENITQLGVRLRGRSSFLDALFGKVVSVAEDISGGETILSPSRRIPPEVLQQIFVFAASSSQIPDHVSTSDGNPDYYIPDSLGARSLPWVLTFVCRRWRGAAIHCPTLWSHVHLKVHQYRYLEIPKSLALNLFLRRSGTSMLSVYIYSTVNISRHPVIATLLTTSERWRTLWLNLPFDAFSALSHIDHCLPELVSVAASMTGEARASGTPIATLLTAPKLTDLTLNRALFLRIPFDRITRLTTTGPNKEVCSLLGQCSTIESCRVRTSGGVRAHQPRREAFVKVLDVASGMNSSRSSVSDFFNHLALPYTIELSIHLGNAKDKERAIMTPFFLHDTVPELRTLRVFAHNGLPEDLDIVRMLRHTPHLTVLEIRIPVACFADTMVLILQYLSGEPIVFPMLRVLKVLPIDGRWNEWTKKMGDRFLSLLEFRRSFLDPRLAHVEVGTTCSVIKGLDGDFATRLESLLADKQLTLA